MWQPITIRPECTGYGGNKKEEKTYHYNDVIMSTIASQITSLAIVYSTVYSDADQRKHKSSASLAFVRGIPGEFPAQRASNAENVSIWWHHHVRNKDRSRKNINTYKMYLLYLRKIYHSPLTHWGRDNMAAISLTIFSNGFTWIKM